ncbi:unnamed protein product [Porites lobata]|uniref:Uncharacterized protein n=1 Tax=Porites lobata TaxID=104759 RepID=A0ABN8RZC6_9CNID|nr:unnamed protein product [Porites lobata]
MAKIISTLEGMTNKHAPIERASRSKRKLLRKPWISKGIFQSVKEKQRLFKTHFFSGDPLKIIYYKAYNNKLTKIKDLAKQKYFKEQFEINKDNMKTTWKMFDLLINRKRKKSPTISKIVYNNKCYTSKLSICNQLNTYFVNVGPTLSAQLPNHINSNPTRYVTRNFPNSFMFRYIHSHEVRDLITNLTTDNAFTTQIKKIQTKQNHVIRVMFFATLFGPDTDSALPLLNLLDLLTVTNIYKLQLLNFTHQWHSKKLPNIFNQHFRYASEVHTYNTRYASKSNFYKPRSRTNIGKQTTAAMATELWQQLPTHIKDLSTYNFPKTLKEYLLAEQLTH